MPVLLLWFNEIAREKLTRRGIDPVEIDQVRANGPALLSNPRPRHPGSRRMIGVTDGGRVLTAVIEPSLTNGAEWDVRTAWVARVHERKAYHRR